MNSARATLLRLVGPPLLALLGAVGYMSYRSDRAEAAVAAFCATIVPGSSTRVFLERARDANLEVHERGAQAATLVASRAVYSWNRVHFECRAERDAAGFIRRVYTARRSE